MACVGWRSSAFPCIRRASLRSIAPIISLTFMCRCCSCRVAATSSRSLICSSRWSKSSSLARHCIWSKRPITPSTCRCARGGTIARSWTKYWTRLSPGLARSSQKQKEAAVNFEDIKNNVKVCMFDQYGTVVDMQGGLTAIAAPFLKAKGWTGDPNAFVTWWRRTHLENSMIDALLHREHTPYREIGHRAVAHVMDRAGIKYTQEDVRYLVGEIEKLKPFPEVPPALEKLHTKYKLVVLSNGDPDMLETAKQYHNIAFDRVISVAEANSFKPHVATYTKAAELLALKPDQILFVANHAFDCIGAKSAGMRTAFIDRRRRPFGETPHQPDIVVPTMQDLADAIV